MLPSSPTPATCPVGRPGSEGRLYACPRPRAHTHRGVVLVGRESSLGSGQSLAGLQEEGSEAQESERGGAWGLAGGDANPLPSVH